MSISRRQVVRFTVGRDRTASAARKSPCCPQVAGDAADDLGMSGHLGRPAAGLRVVTDRGDVGELLGKCRLGVDAGGEVLLTAPKGQRLRLKTPVAHGYSSRKLARPAGTRAGPCRQLTESSVSASYLWSPRLEPTVRPRTARQSCARSHASSFEVLLVGFAVSASRCSAVRSPVRKSRLTSSLSTCLTP